MNTALPATAPSDSADPSGDRPAAGVAADADAAWVLGSLKEMAETGLRLMRRLEAEVARTAETGAPGPIGGDNPVAAYDRLTRSLRLTLGLRDRLIDAASKRAREDAEARKARLSAAAHRPRAAARRDRMVNAVAGALLERDTDHADAAEILVGLQERLIEREWERDPGFSRVTIAEAVALICKDFRIPYDPSRWIGATMTLEEAASTPLDPPAAGARPAEAGPHAVPTGHDPPEAPG